MPATQQITLTLPDDLVERLKSKVSSGEFATESEVLHASLIDFLNPVQGEDSDLELWLRTETARRCEEADAHPEELLSADDMRRAIEEELQAIQQGN